MHERVLERIQQFLPHMLVRVAHPLREHNAPRTIWRPLAERIGQNSEPKMASHNFAAGNGT